ncbi:MAG: hypothetical protein IIX96_02565, partial [Clostridia bacterium]|nr:hypothetical protein [Clostridia bacterium]
MKKLSKILACLLVAVLMLTGVVLVAAAEGEALEATTADGITVTKHNDLAEAITAAGEGGTVKLLANYSATANVVITADLTIDLGDGKKLDMASFTLSVSGGAEVTVKNGLVTSAESNNNSGYYVIDVSGADTTINFDKVRVVNSADLFKVSDHATVNVSGTWDNTRWEAKRCNFNITDASVNLDGVNIYCQHNNMIVIKGKDARLTINNSNIETGNRTIELIAGYAADGVNSAMAEGEYHVKVTNSTLKNPTYAILKSSPYLTSVKDSSYLYWNIEGTTAYHWEEVTLAEGTDASAWLTELAALTLTHDSRDAGKKQIVTPRKTEGGKYYELKEGLPYHHSEV